MVKAFGISHLNKRWETGIHKFENGLLRNYQTDPEQIHRQVYVSVVSGSVLL